MKKITKKGLDRMSDKVLLLFVEKQYSNFINNTERYPDFVFDVDDGVPGIISLKIQKVGTERHVQENTMKEGELPDFPYGVFFLYSQ